MQVMAILADQADASDNLLTLSRGGIDRAFAPAGAPGPYAVTLSMGIFLLITEAEAATAHTLTVDVLDGDGVPARIGDDVVHVETTFEVSRPPTIHRDDPQGVSLAINFPGLPLPELGRYGFHVAVDGVEHVRLPYAIEYGAQPGPSVVDPAGIPKF